MLSNLLKTCVIFTIVVLIICSFLLFVAFITAEGYFLHLFIVLTGVLLFTMIYTEVNFRSKNSKES